MSLTTDATEPSLDLLLMCAVVMVVGSKSSGTPMDATLLTTVRFSVSEFCSQPEIDE